MIACDRAAISICLHKMKLHAQFYSNVGQNGFQMERTPLRITFVKWYEWAFEWHTPTSLNKSQFLAMNNWINYAGWLVNWFEKWPVLKQIRSILSETLCGNENKKRTKIKSTYKLHQQCYTATEQLSWEATFFSTLILCLLLLLRYIDNFICLYYFIHFNFISFDCFIYLIMITVYFIRNNNNNNYFERCVI